MRGCTLVVCLFGGLLRGSAAFDLTCQIPTVYARLLHSVDVSPPMAKYYGPDGALKSAMQKFDDWMRVEFESGVYTAVDTFSDKKIFDAENKCWEEIQPLQDVPITIALDTIQVQPTGSPKRSVYDALYRAASIDWDTIDATGKGRKFTIVYTTGLPNGNSGLPAFNNSTDCENVEYPSTMGAIQALIASAVTPIFVVPRELLDVYRLTFMTDLVIPYSNDVDEMTLLLQMSIDALYCNAAIVIPDGSTPSPFVSTTTAQLCADKLRAQILLVQDVSHSYTNDLVVLRQKMPEIVVELSKHFDELEMGLVTFSDKPTPPYGYEGDHCYKEEAPMSSNFDLFTSTLASLDILSGNDWREAQYDALISGITSEDIGWVFDDDQLLRVALVATDAGPHEAGDSALPTYDNRFTPCAERDYPSPARLGATLDEKRVWPVFMVTPDLLGYWAGRSEKIITEHTPQVVGLHSDPKDIVKEIMKAVDAICGLQTTVE